MWIMNNNLLKAVGIQKLGDYEGFHKFVLPEIPRDSFGFMLNSA